MKQTMEIKKENGEIIKMELVIAGAANLTEMQIVKVNKFNEEAKIGYYTVNNDTDEAMLGIYVKQEKDVTKAYGAAKARNGIAYITATKTSSTMKHYKSAKFMEKALKAYELTLEEVKNAMETLKAAAITNNMVDVSEYAVSIESQEVAVQAEIANTNNASEKASKSATKKQHFLTRLRKLPLIISFFNTEITKQLIRRCSIEKRRKRNLESWQWKLIKVATINTSSSCLTKCRQELNAVPSLAVKTKVLPVNMLEAN